MGPAILKKQGKKTLYSLRVLPIGGYCAMEGETEDSDDANSFRSKSVPKRILICAAGAAMNIILGFILMLVTLIGEAGYFVEEVEGERRQITIEIEPGSALPSDAFLDEVVADVKSTVAEHSWQAPLDIENESDYGITDYVDTDYGPENDGVTDYGADTDYGPNNDGVTDYGADTDYGPDNDGVTDYDSDGASNYGDDGATNYGDDGATNYGDSAYGY